MKKLVKFFTLFLSLTVLVCLAGCKKPAQYTAQQMADAIQFANDKKDVTFEFAVDKQVERLYEGSETEKQVAPITWTSDDTRIKIEDYKVYVKYDETNNTAAKIKGEVEVNGEKASQEFQVRIVPEATYSEFISASKGTSMNLSGYISHLGEYSASYKNFSMQILSSDKEHSFYAYRASCDAATYKQLSVGQLVGLSGEVDVYNDSRQLSKSSITILKGEKVTDSTIDITENDLSTENLVNKANRLVKVTAEVIDTPIDDKGNYRVYALVGNTKVQIQNNKNFYESGSTDAENVKNAILGLKLADKVTVEGYLGNFFETPTITLVNPSKLSSEAGSADRVTLLTAKTSMEKALKDADLTKAGEITFTLPEGVTAEITLDNNEQQVVKVEGNKLVIAPTSTETKVTLSVKLTKGTETFTFTKNIVVKLPSVKVDTLIKYTGTTTQNMVLNENNAAMVGLDAAKWEVTTNVAWGDPTAEKHGSTVGLNKDGTIRLYADKDLVLGNKLTIKSLENKNISVVVLHFAKARSASSTMKVNNTQINVPAAAEQVKVELDTPVSEIVLHNNSTSGQVWFDKIEFVFAK